MMPLFRSAPVDYIDYEMQERLKNSRKPLDVETVLVETLTKELAKEGVQPIEVKVCKCGTCKCSKMETPTPPIGEMGEPTV